MRNKKPPLFMLMLLMPFASIGGVLFTPALPIISSLLNVSEGPAQAMMTAYLVGYALGNLPYGPFTKRFGRKPSLYVGILVAILGALLTIFAGEKEHFYLFLLGRFVTALGTSVGMKLTFTMIADSYRKTQIMEKIAFSTLAFTTAPVIAVVIGGILTSHYGWQSCFYAIIAYSLLLLGGTLFLPETASYFDKEALHPLKIKKIYLEFLQHRPLVFASLMMGFATAVTYTFATLSPFIGIRMIGLSPQTFGLFNFIPLLGFISGCIAAHKLSKRWEKITCIQVASIIALVSTCAMFALFQTSSITALKLFLPITFAYLGTSIVFINAIGLAFEQVEDKANGAALMSFINMGTVALIIFISESIDTPVRYELPVILVTCTLMLLLLSRKFRKIAKA